MKARLISVGRLTDSGGFLDATPAKSTIFDMIGSSVGLDVFLTIKRRREKLLEYLEGRSRYPLQDSDAQTILLAISVGASPLNYC
jgi:hypothetical protein